MLEGIERTAKAVAAMADAPAPEIKIVEGAKAVINDPGVVGTAEKVLEGGLRRQVQADAAEHAQRGLFGVRQCRRALDVLQHRRLRARARRAPADGTGPPLPSNHSPQFAPVPKPTIKTGVTAMTLAVLSAFDQRAKGQ